MKMKEATRMLLGCVMGRWGIFNTASFLWPCQKYFRGFFIVGVLLSVFAFFQAAPVMGEEAAAPGGLPATAAGPPLDAQAPMTDIHDILPPVSVGLDMPWLWIVLIAVGAVVLAAVAWGLWQKYRKTRAIETVVPELPPELVARQALDQLSDVRGMEGKTFYFRLSAILRRYVFGRFSVGAPEMTTEEFLPCIDRLSLKKEMARGLKSLCRAMDPVKFGGQETVEKQMETDLIFVREFVRKTAQQINMEEENNHGEQPVIVPINDKNSKRQIPNLK